MNIYAYPPLVSACLFLIIGFVAYWRSESESTVKIPFSFLCVLTVAWQMSWTVLFNVEEPRTADLIIKIGYSAIIFLPVAYYHFIARFCGIRKAAISYIYAGGLILLALHLTSNLLIDGHYSYFFGYYPKFGLIHPVFLASLFSLTSISFVFLYLDRKKTDEPKRLNQIRYIGVSFALYCMAATDFLVNYGIGFYPFGVVFIVSSLAIMSYAMARHELLDIHLVIKKTVYYSVLLILLILPMLPVFYLAEQYASPAARYGIYSVVLVVVAFLYPRIRVRAGRNLDNILFGERLDYRKAFNDLSREISHLQPLEELAGKVSDTISWAIDVEAVATYHYSSDTGYFVLKACHGDAVKWQPEILSNDITLSAIKEEGDINNFKLNVKGLDEGITRIPVTFENNLIAFILIEKPLSEFEEDELLVLSTIANQLAVAINNSQQFDAINNLNTNLESTVQERTRDLQKAYDELKHLTNIKTDFFNRVSHELRTPLSNIILPIEAAMNTMGSNMDKRNYQEKKSILRNASVLMKRINEILDIAKLESGEVVIRAREQSIDKLIEDVLSGAIIAAKRAGIAIKINSSSTSHVFVDADKIERVLANIINNAMKFTDEGGVIDISTEEDHDVVRVDIADSGCGIPENQIANIFDPFKQADTVAKRQHTGTGLGLAIAKEFMDLHHGEIEVTSKEGEGSRFRLIFKKGSDHFSPEQIEQGDNWPNQERRTRNRRESVDRRDQKPYVWEVDGAAPDVVEVPASDGDEIEEAKISQHFGEKKKILVVEDNKDLVMNMTHILSGMYEVITASNGEEGLEMAKEVSPDLIISDVMMPRKDGISMCKDLRDGSVTRDIPIVLLTAKTGIKTKIHGLRIGADYYLEKPFNIKELLTIVSSLLSKQEYQNQILRKNNELIDAYEQLKVAQRDAELASKAKSTFVANMSHEIRTPLNAIIGYADLLREECLDSNNVEYANDLEKIRRSGKHLLTLISGVLDLSKIEAGKMSVTPEPFYVEAFLNDIAVMTSPVINKNNNTLSIEIDEHVAQVTTDQTKLKQILINLIGNASKFTNNGEIKISVNAVVVDGSSYIQINVIDNGIGMTEDQLSRIFVDFNQADSSTTKKYGGTGLGLSLSQKLSALLGGKITVKSTYNEGSTFTLTIPMVLQVDNDEDQGVQEPISEAK